MVWHTIYGQPEAARSWCQEDGKMKETYFKYALQNDDLVIVEIRRVRSPKYIDGIMFTFRCMSANGETLFAIENSHGQPHMHLKGKKEDVDYDWKIAYGRFDGMVAEHKKKIMQR